MKIQMIKRYLKAKLTKRNVLVLVILLILSFLIAEKNGLAPFRTSPTGIDSSVFKYIATEMQDGKTPYLDTFDHKGPLLFIINYIGNLIAYWRGVWIFTYLAVFLALFFFYKIAKSLKLNWWLSVIVVVLVGAVVGIYFGENSGNYTQEYALPFISGGLFVFIDYFVNDKISNARLFLCGAFLGGVFLLQPNLASVWVVLSLAVLVRLVRRKEVSSKLWSFLLPFFFGFVVVVLPVLTWLGIKGALPDYFYSNFIFNSKYSAGNGRFAWINSVLHFLSDSWMMIASLSMVFFAFSKKNKFLYVYLVAFVISLIASNLSGRYYLHYQIVNVPLLVLPFSLLLRFLHSERRAFVVAVGVIMVLFALPTWLDIIQVDVAAFANRGTSTIPKLVNDVVDVVRQNSEDGDQISVYGNWDIIYLLSNRRSASKYSYQFDPALVDDTIFPNYLEDLNKNNPTLIVIRPEYWWGPYEEFDPLIFGFIEDNDYSLIWEEEVEEGSLRGALVFKKN